MNSFYDLFYGPGARNMGRLYQLLSEQAQIRDDTWDSMSSSARNPYLGQLG